MNGDLIDPVQIWKLLLRERANQQGLRSNQEKSFIHIYWKPLKSWEKNFSSQEIAFLGSKDKVMAVCTIAAILPKPFPPQHFQNWLPFLFMGLVFNSLFFFTLIISCEWEQGNWNRLFVMYLRLLTNNCTAPGNRLFVRTRIVLENLLL